jgi:hypothetical protein
VLGQFEVVAADRFDGAFGGAAVGQLDPDRPAPPGQLVQGEGEVVAVSAAAGGRLQRGLAGRQRQGGGLEADQVLPAVRTLQDEEVG